MIYGEVFFDMTRDEHPITGSAVFMLKRWTKHTMYAKSGSYNRTDNPRENLYATNSIYLYDHVLVSDTFFYENVYTASTYDSTPAADSYYSYSSPDDPTIWASENRWYHYENTFRNSPNAITNNYVFTLDPNRSVVNSISTPLGVGHPYYSLPVVYRDDGVYFEIVRGYPRNHYTHKRGLFSLYSLTTHGIVNGAIVLGKYLRNSQTVSSTIGEDGLEDGTPPVQSVQVGNLNLVQTDNVINS